jgi:putative two-component system response regulator
MPSAGLVAILYNFTRKETAFQVKEYLRPVFSSVVEIDNLTEFTTLMAKGLVPDLLVIYNHGPVEKIFSCCVDFKAQSKVPSCPIAVIGRLADETINSKAIEVGINEWINWPTDQFLFKNKIEVLVQHRKYQIQVENRARELTAEIALNQNAAIESIAALVECKDDHTGKHIQRTKAYLKILVDEMTRQDIYSEQLTPEYIELIIKTSPLHDIGKVGIEDKILMKPKRLNSAEFDKMKKHTVMGGDALGKAMERTGANPFLKCAEEIARFHHEKWNGSGYPEGLVGHGIPLCARLMAVADVYDAARNKRIYKDPKTHEIVVEEIKRDSGIYFDPLIIKAFSEASEKFRQISITLTSSL